MSRRPVSVSSNDHPLTPVHPIPTVSSASPARDIFVGRQPIYDRNLELFAYELLFRTDAAGQANVENGDEATFTVLLNALVEIGLPRLVGDRRVFINLTRNSILCEYPHFLPRDQVVLEVLETAHVDEEFLTMVRDFVGQGYTVALDDFVYQESLRPLLKLASIVKIDVRGLETEALARQVELFRGHRLVAEKVETREQFESCRDLGFDYFQGFFLCRPKVVTVKHVPTSQLATLRLLIRIHDPDAELEDLVDVIGQDVSLSYRLIRTVNSALYSLPTKIDSIGHAVSMLGMQKLRTWVTLLSIAGMDDIPSELMVTAMVRARMCELLAARHFRPQCQRFFLVGLFSVLDALMGAPLPELLEALPLAEDINAALVQGRGPAGLALHSVIAYEQGRWEEVSFPGMGDQQIADCYLKAIAWADEARASIGF